jgi:hypothetical protein
MRILIIQENGRHEKNRNFRECFSMQRALEFFDNDVDVWGLGHLNFEKQIDYDSYDLIVNLENYDEDNWVPNLSKVNTKKILWVIDAHVRGMEVYNEEYERGRYDLILQATKDYVQDDSSVWFPNCYDNDLIYPANIEKNHFIGFCGSVLNRHEILNLLTEKYGLKQDIFVIGEDMVDAVSSYNIHFNMNLANDINYRSFETLGCGTVLLTNDNPQYQDLGFIDGKNCLIYNSYDSLCGKIEMCMDDPELMIDIVKNGYDLSDKHTYYKRAKLLLQHYERFVV